MQITSKCAASHIHVFSIQLLSGGSFERKSRATAGHLRSHQIRLLGSLREYISTSGITELIYHHTHLSPCLSTELRIHKVWMCLYMLTTGEGDFFYEYTEWTEGEREAERQLGLWWVLTSGNGWTVFKHTCRLAGLRPTVLCMCIHPTSIIEKNWEYIKLRQASRKNNSVS